jgi:hypothetical protein
MMKLRSIFGAVAISGLLAMTGCENNHEIVTRSEFQKIKPGMTLDQVNAAIGSEGRKMSPTESIPGTLSVSSDRASLGDEVYVWVNRDSSNASVQFSSGLSIAAAQRNL